MCWPDRVQRTSVMVPEIMIGASTPSSSNTPWTANIFALALRCRRWSRSGSVLGAFDQQQHGSPRRSSPPARQGDVAVARNCSRPEIEQVRLVGPDAGDEARLVQGLRRSSRRLASQARPFDVEFVGAATACRSRPGTPGVALKVLVSRICWRRWAGRPRVALGWRRAARRRRSLLPFTSLGQSAGDAGMSSAIFLAVALDRRWPMPPPRSPRGRSSGQRTCRAGRYGPR